MPFIHFTFHLLYTVKLKATLEQAIRQNKITFKHGNTPKPFLERYMRQITLCLSQDTYTFYVDDEFNEAEKALPSLLLNMILMECTWFEEEADYLTWCGSKGLNAGDETVRRYYMELGHKINSLKTRLGPLNHTSFYDWQLNAGEAQELRNSRT